MRLVSVTRAGLAILVALVGCGKASNSSQQGAQGAAHPMPVEVISLAPGEVKDTGEYLGQLISRRSVTLLPQVAGYVQSIRVRPGQRVEKGQVRVRGCARRRPSAPRWRPTSNMPAARASAPHSSSRRG